MTAGVGMLPEYVHGGKPVTVSVGELPMFDAPVAPVIVPEMAHEIPVPARTPNAAAELSGDATTTTVACTVLLNAPDTRPDVKLPKASIVPPPLTMDQTGLITNTLPLASLPTARK